MKVHNLSSAAFFALAFLLRAWAQTAAATSGIYEISSGEYIECCSIAGEKHILLPNSGQHFVKLSIDQRSQIASMSIVGDDMQTLFTITPLCPPAPAPIPFSFNGGFMLADRIIFHVDPAPNGLYWNYTLSNSPTSLIINGLLGF